MKRERERENNDVSARWQPGGGRKNKKCHLNGNAEALKKVMPLFDVYPKGRATI